jgi:hypothetical protein
VPFFSPYSAVSAFFMTSPLCVNGMAAISSYIVHPNDLI